MDYGSGDTVVCLRTDPSYPPALRCTPGSLYKVATVYRMGNASCYLCKAVGDLWAVAIEGQPSQTPKQDWWQGHCVCEFRRLGPEDFGAVTVAKETEPGVLEPILEPARCFARLVRGEDP